MRLAVNQEGERVFDDQVNRLTVIANESYRQYCERLQSEYMAEVGTGQTPPQPKNARRRRTVHLKKGFELDPRFRELWQHVARRTRYRVQLDVDALVTACAKAVAPCMKAQKSGRIINIGSSVAFMSHFGFTQYLTSKAAIIGLTRSMAGELGEFGITVNNVGPGTIMTEARKVYTTEEAAMEKARHQLVKRPPVSEDITGMVVYLASDESAMMTGQTVVIDGGVVLH